MLTRAAVIMESPGKIEVVPVDLEDPRRGEIRVKMVAAGLCHSDAHLQTGDAVAAKYPMVVGHEGAGIVDMVGPDTAGWAVGDHVIFSFIPSCGHCRWCSEGMTNLCDLGANLMWGSRFDDNESFRFRLQDGTEAGQLCGLGCFADHTTISVDSAIKVDKELPLDKACLLGCGVGTGWGSAVYSAETRPGDVIIVMGVGGIGINAVQGASHAGATAVIAVDPIELKRDAALKLGATHAFASIEDATEYARSITNGQGADKTILTAGVVHGEDMAYGIESIRKAGTLVITGVTPMAEIGIPISALELTLMQKRIQGATFGACNPRSDVPRQIQMYRAGQLKLDELITNTYSLDDIGLAYDDMLSGRNIRGVIKFD